MDRRNGSDPLVPPRPPKQLPRVHRARAPEPETMMSETQTQQEQQQQQQQQMTSTAATQCTNSNRQQTQQLLNSNNNSNQHSITTTVTNNNGANNNNTTVGRNIGSSIQNNNVAAISTVAEPDFEDYQIHHLTFLPQRPSSLSRNNSHVSTTSTSTSAPSLTAVNTFTRRRPPPPALGVAAPLLTISSSGSSARSTVSSNLSSNINNNNGSSNITTSGGLASLLSHFHSAEPAPVSPVTLAQPRPETERLTNEYVDTPLRNASGNAAAQQPLQLQHASRTQHPAGQHDGGQTTTHHLLLLPQRELRLQQQQQHQHQQHSNRLAGTAGSATATTGTDGTDGFLHSHHNHKSPASTATSATTACPHTGKLMPVSQNWRSSGCLGSFAPCSPATQPITQPITKQPALTTNQATHGSNNCKFAKDIPALDDLLDMHNIATGIATPQGMVSAVNGASPLGTPIIIGGDTASLNQITCPQCGRCRCEQCQSPRQLPQTWLCNKTCLCSAESVIDYVSCLCCAKALFYHCARDNDMDCDDGSGTPCVDNPCSCGPYKRTQRWGWLGALSLVLPCLWFYWPMRGCVTLCEKCYGRYAGRGCRCQQIGSTSSMLPIVQLGINGNGSNAGSGMLNGNTGGTGATKSTVPHHHHNECSSAASRILRKGDLTPEKRLLDSSPEY